MLFGAAWLLLTLKYIQRIVRRLIIYKRLKWIVRNFHLRRTCRMKVNLTQVPPQAWHGSHADNQVHAWLQHTRATRKNMCFYVWKSEPPATLSIKAHEWPQRQTHRTLSLNTRPHWPLSMVADYTRLTMAIALIAAPISLFIQGFSRRVMERCGIASAGAPVLHECRLGREAITH